MATRGTLASAKFQALLATHSGGPKAVEFIVQPCDGLAHAIEASAETGDATRTIALCAHYISAMGRFGTETGQIDTLVLGCTHYPFASEHLRALVGAQVQFIDNGEAVARQTLRLLPACLMAANAPPGRSQPVHHRPAGHAAGGGAALAGAVGAGQFTIVLIAACACPACAIGLKHQFFTSHAPLAAIKAVQLTVLAKAQRSPPAPPRPAPSSRRPAPCTA